jgi:hypothetical protein
MRKIIQITESQLKQMVKRMIMEQPSIPPKENSEKSYYHAKEETDECSNKLLLLKDFFNGKTLSLKNINYKIVGTDIPFDNRGRKPQMFFLLKPFNQGEDKLLEILCTGKSTLFNSFSKQSGVLKTLGNFKVDRANYDGKQIDVTNESSIKGMFGKFKPVCDSCLKSKIDFTMSNKNNNTDKMV